MAPPKTTAKAALRKVPTAKAAGPSFYMTLYRAAPFERIERIKRGVLATEAKRIIDDLAMEQGVGLKALNLSPATVNRKAKQHGALSPEESERVLGIAKLVGQVETMVEESGDPAGFNAAEWLSRWLQQPVPALGDARPIDLMNTMEGQALVSTTLAQMQSGAYA